MKIGNIGNKLDLQFRQGTTFGPYQLTLKNQDATPVDLTGCSIAGTVSKTHSVFPLTVDILFVVTDAVNGVVAMSITKENTALLKGNPDSNPEYVYDTTLTFSDGTAEPLFYGEVYVKNSV